MRKVFYVMAADDHGNAEESFYDIARMIFSKKMYDDTLVVVQPEDNLTEGIRSVCTSFGISTLSIPKASEIYGPGLSDRRRYRFITDLLTGLRDHGYSVQLLVFQDFLSESDRELFDALSLMYLLEFDVTQYRSDGTIIYGP